MPAATFNATWSGTQKLLLFGGVVMNSPKKMNRKYLHELIVTDFKFDAFAVEELYPNPNLKKLGDEKLQVTKKK